MKKLASLLAFAVALVAHAESVTLSNADAARLFSALRTTQAGVSALNTRNGALNLNALRPVVEAYEVGQNVISAKAAKIAQNDPDRAKKGADLAEEAMQLTKAKNTVNLTMLDLSDAEIKEARISMDSLAEFIRFLTPSAAPPAKK